MATVAEILELLGSNPVNADHLSWLEEQLSRRSGIVPFVGAGMSAPFGYKQWGQFLLELAAEAGTTERIQQRLAASQYEEAAEDLVRDLEVRRFQDLVAKHFGDQRIAGQQISGAVAELARFPPGPLITTNFDRVLETAHSQAGRPVQAFWHSQASKASEAFQQDRPFLLKLHGDWADSSTRVLTYSEYQQAYGDVAKREINFRLPLPMLLYKLMATRCCLFLGCSLRQDRTIEILKWIARDVPDLVHYAIVEQPADADAYRSRRVELSAQMIRPVWYPAGRHDLIEPLLAYLAGRAWEGTKKGLPAAAPLARETPNNIPKPGNETIGRETEIAQLTGMMRSARLTTIWGPGGCGKSRLAAEVASRLQEHFPDGVWFIPLADLAKKADRERVLPARIGRIANVAEQAGRPPNETLAEHFGAGRYLLVLDNCEHLLTSCREVAEFLLARCQDLAILATSRRPLSLSAERLYPLAPLMPPDREMSDLAAIESNESVRLFSARVRERSPDFRLDGTNVAAVAELCRVLDGIPLALELAAARFRVRSVEQMIEDSRDLLNTIGSLRSGEMRRWKTLTAAIRWSYELLGAREQAFLRAMAVFDGGWTAEAAAAVSGDPDAAAMIEALDENSLISISEAGGRKRFRFLEPIRQFAHLQLDDPERAERERRHAEHFLGVAETAAPGLLRGHQAEVLDRLQGEADNFRAAVRWACGENDAESALRLMAALWRFMEIRGYFAEGRDRAAAVLQLPATANFPSLRSKVLSGCGMLAYRQADYSGAERMFEESLRIEEELGNSAGVANALNDLGIVARATGRFDRARSLFDRCLTAEMANGNARGAAVARFNLGFCALAMGDAAAAEPFLSASLHGFQDGNNERESAFPLNTLGQAAIVTGDIALAEDYASRSLEIRRRLKDAKGIADALRTLGWAAIERGDFQAARNQLTESASMARGVGDKDGVAESLELAGVLASRMGHNSQAVQLLAAAEQLRISTGGTLSPLRADRRDGALRASKEALGEAEANRAWRRGAALTPNQAAELMSA